MEALKIDPEFHSLIPPLRSEERELLAKSIKAEGCRDVLVVWNSLLLDGHNRYEICTNEGIHFGTVDLVLKNRDAAKAWIITNQLARRNLTAYQRAELALKLKPVIVAKAKERQRQSKGRGQKGSQNSGQVKTEKELAKIAGVSHDTIARAQFLQEHADEPTKAKLRTGETSINAAFKATAREQRRAAKPPREFPSEQYAVIYADPPWQYDYSPTHSREIEKEYPTMPLAEIEALPVGDIAQPDVVLFLWATSPKLREALSVIAAWGFTYKTCMVWVKDKIGMGYYARQQHELLLIATRGTPPTPDPSNRPSSVVIASRGQHSTKPPAMREVIERMYPKLNKIELFAREQHEGWTAWGNEV